MIIKGIMGTAGPSTIIIQYLKSLGIKIRLLKKSLSLEGQKKSSGERLFGVPLPLLPLCKTEGGVPQLLVNICQFLGDHLGTEGLFRKSGSVIRIKALKAQLEYGECPLDSAHPGDVACLLKQFFRELPLPLIPPELQDPLCQIQETLNEKQRVLATTLVTCLLPAIHANTLCYLCTFLQSVAARSEENRMDSGNLAVVLAPNLFSSGVLGEKLTIGTERQLQLQASAMQTLIEHAEHIGQTPAFILEMISFPANPLAEDLVTLTSGGSRRRRRRSMGGLVNEALNKLKSGLASSSATPERAAATDERDHPVRCKVKRKATEDSVPTEQGTAKKRKSVGAGEDENSGTEHGTAAVSPLRETGIEGDMFLEVPPAPGPCLELTAVPPDPVTAESTAQAPRARSKKKDGKRGQRSQSGLILVSPAHLERRDKVRNSLRLFHRPRTAKNQTPEGKNAEESSWNYMKRMVTEALEGPIFNGKDLRATSSSLKANLRVDISSSRSSLQTTAVWKSIETEASSGKKSRALRRSLSMPENMADCTKPKEDGNPFQSMDSSTSAENLTQDGGVIKQPEEIPHTPLGFTGFYLSSPPKVPSLHNSISVCALPLSSPCLSKATGQLAQYRSVRKLMLSMPWAPQMADLEDPEQKDWGKLATNSIRRQGARRFGRSLSHESGIGLAEGIEEQNCPEFPPAQKILKGRSVFVSHKNITLCAAGQRSFDILESDDPSLEEVPVDTGDHPTETIFSHSKDPTCFETLSEENKPYCGIFSAHPFYGAHLELLEDCIDL